MGRCSYCGKDIDHPFPCRHCNNSYCGDHRLPENHECPLYVPDEEFGGTGPDTREIRNDRATRKQRLSQQRTSRERKKSEQDESPKSSSKNDAFCDNCGKVYYSNGLCKDCRNEEKDTTDTSEAEASASELNTSTPPDSPEPNVGSSGNAGNESEKKTSNVDFESSPDVAPDGTIASSEDASERVSEESESHGSLFHRLLAMIKTPLSSTGEGSNEPLSSRYQSGQYSNRRGSTRSSPSLLSRIYLRFKIWLYRLAIISVIATIGIFGIALTVGTGVPIIDNTASDVSAAAQDYLEEEPLDRSQIERDIHYYVNQEREDRGLEPLAYDTDLRDIARYHSQDMVDQDYFAHDSPDGETVEDRYERFGIACSGGENIAYTYADQDLQTDSGTVDHDNNETRIARGIVRQWMNSKGHRENILRPRYQREGIGIIINEDEKGTQVMATQNFC